MAVDPVKAKRNINFDVYEKPDPSQNINWAEQAKVISDAFTGVATDRAKRKQDIDDDTKKNLDALNNLDAMDNQTLMDMTIDGSNNAANAIYEAEQAMKRGELRPQDFQKLKQNISSGFTQFQKNAKQWDADFKRYSERLEAGTSSSLEQYLGERMESFGNLKNMQLVTNPTTGNLAFARMDPETGELMTGPDDLISINRMTAISKQQIDKVDMGKAVDATVAQLGDYITAGNATAMNKDGSSRSVVTIDDFMQTPEADTYLRDKAKAVTTSPFETGSLLSDNGVQNSLGQSFFGGSQEDFDKWASENPDADQSQNPVIVMGYKKNGVLVEPDITEGQKKAAEDYYVRQIRAKLGREETMKESSFQYRAKSGNEIAISERDERAGNIYNTVKKLVSGDAEESGAAGTELASSINSQNSGNKNYVPIQEIERVGDKFIVRRKGMEDFTVDAIVDNKPVSGDDIGAAIWNEVTDGSVTFEKAAGGRTIGDRGKGDAKSSRTATTLIEQPDYATNIVIDGKETSIKKAVDGIDDIGYSPGSPFTGTAGNVKKKAKQYQNVFQEVFKNKNTPGLEEAFRGEEISITPAENSNGDMYNLQFKIGDMTFNYPNDVEGYESGDATSGEYDENTDIWPQVELFINQAIEAKKGKSKGGGGGAVDAFGNPI